jgi:protein kinase-like protein
MSLAAGTRIGAYEVRDLLGIGGMGEVYRAWDTKLKREVALKILPEAFARDPGRMARFQREAELLASLNHSGIAHVYGVEENAFVGRDTRRPVHSDPRTTALPPAASNIAAARSERSRATATMR